MSAESANATSAQNDTEPNSTELTGTELTSTAPITPLPPHLRRRRIQEIWLVLGVSLGASAVYAALSLLDRLTAGPPLAQQTATLNSSQSDRPWLDLTYQLVGIGFTLVPAALALWLLAGGGSAPSDLKGSGSGGSGARRIGLTGERPARDALSGLALAAVIGLPGLAFYWLGHELGITVTVVAAALNDHWWTVPVLIVQALKNGLIEEVVVVGYLGTRLRSLGWSAPAWIAASAVLRGSYHLYQGIGPFFGNAVMGVVFGLWFRRTGRVMPLVIAHTVLDIVSFVGYDLLQSHLKAFGLA